MYFGENGIIENALHKNKKLININELDIKRIVLSGKNHMVIKIHLNTLFDKDIKVVFFHHHYV